MKSEHIYARPQSEIFQRLFLDVKNVEGEEELCRLKSQRLSMLTLTRSGDVK